MKPLELDPRLFGRWISERGADGGAGEKTTIEFLADGSLTYTIAGPERDDVMLLTFRTEEGSVVSNQPSAPHEERTPYSFTVDGKLMMLSGGELLTYVRAD